MLVFGLLNKFQGFVMSVVPSSTLPKCTRTVVLDLLFMQKYLLSKTETMVFYYLSLLKTWVKYRDGEYFVILSKKIEQDLKLHPKTVEASLTKLKKLDLITTKRVEVKEWNENKKYRAIAITSIGREYNLSHYKESEYQYSRELEKENEAFRVQQDELVIENKKLKREKEELELQPQTDDKILKEAIDRANRLESEKKELEAKLELVLNQQTQTPNEKKQKEKDIDTFQTKIIKEYARTGRPICNAVKINNLWAVKTRFYINSYSRLAIYTESGNSKQIADPKQIEDFWKWLFDHQNRVGVLLDETKKADISPLIGYIDKPLLVNQKPYRVTSLKPVIGGVEMKLTDGEGKILDATNGHGSYVLDVEKSLRWLEEHCVLV